MAKRSPRAQANEAAAPAQPVERSNMKLVEPNRETEIRDIGSRGAGMRGSGAADTTSRSMGSEPSEEDIRLRAYQRYLERGGGHGMDFEDWLEAERELKRQA